MFIDGGLIDYLRIKKSHNKEMIDTFSRHFFPNLDLYDIDTTSAHLAQPRKILWNKIIICLRPALYQRQWWSTRASLLYCSTKTCDELPSWVALRSLQVAFSSECDHYAFQWAERDQSLIHFCMMLVRSHAGKRFADSKRYTKCCVYCAVYSKAYGAFSPVLVPHFRFK